MKLARAGLLWASNNCGGIFSKCRDIYFAKNSRDTIFLLPMRIRRAVLADIPLILELISEVVPLMNAAGNFQWDNTYPDAVVFENDIARKQLWLADEEGVVVGVAAITTDQEPEYAGVGWDISEPAIVIHRLAVKPSCQGRGIATALLLQAEQIAAESPIGILRIDTNTPNKATQKLFPRMGYDFAGEIELSFRPGLRFYCYQKLLTSGVSS